MTTNNVDHLQHNYHRSTSVEDVYKKHFSLVRFYLVDPVATEKLYRNFAKFEWNCCATELVETYYDTETSSLSNLECILMKDTKSRGRYWKFFSFAHDNIMEITTDEKEIREPLSRILNYDSPDYITTDLLRPFFSIIIKNFVYIIDGCRVELITTDYGFNFCTITKICLSGDRCADALNEMDILSRNLGLTNLSNYEPDTYL